MPTVSVGDAELDYTDQGSGPVVVLLHGFLMGGSVYRTVAADLAQDHRVIIPELPFGAHRRPIPDQVDLSPFGVARMIKKFLQALDLTEVTLVGNDWAGVQWVMSQGSEPRISRLVIAATEAFENYPPGRGGKALKVLAANQAVFTLALLPMRLPRFRHSGKIFAELARRPVPPELIDRWVEPLLTQPEIRRDFVQLIQQSNPSAMRAATIALGTIGQPTLVLWTTDSVMVPAEHGPRLAEAIPDARLVTIDDCGVLMPLDQPERFAGEIGAFIAS